MKSKKDVTAKLQQIKKTLKISEREFARYDNFDDMKAIEIMTIQIGVLDWVLNEG